MSKAPATDWEKVFEDPKIGLIARVQNARQSPDLGDICCTLVEKLYQRRNDARRRELYRHRVVTIFDGDLPTDAKIDETIVILREIKQDRIVRAGKKRKPRSWAQTLREHHDAASELFEARVLDELQTVFDQLCDGVKPTKDYPLPFFVSKAFAGRFRDIVREDLMADLLIYNKGVITRIESVQPEKREAALKQTFDEMLFRERFFDSWRAVWRNRTEQQEPPPKPVRKKRDLVKSLVSQFMEEPEFDDEMTLEDWEEAAALTEKRNTQARLTWARLVESGDGYEPPTEADKEFLGRLIVHPHEDTQKMIAKLTQMASQKASAKAFNAFQEGKDIDLALLLASLRYPKLFLTGEDPFLKNMMRGYNARDRRFMFPRVDRYLLQDAAE